VGCGLERVFFAGLERRPAPPFTDDRQVIGRGRREARGGDDVRGHGGLREGSAGERARR